MIGIIAAVSKNGIIGNKLSNSLPFNYPEDIQHFRKLTSSSTVIMGRATFESIGKPLPKRRNIVITSQSLSIEGVEAFSNMRDAISIAIHTWPNAYNNIWLMGGFRIYQEGMQYADELHLTLTPDIIDNTNATYFPWINPIHFQVKEMNRLNPTDDTLIYAKYERTVGNNIFSQKHFQ